MDYVEWVERVLFAVADAYQHPETPTRYGAYDARDVARLFDLNAGEAGPILAVSDALHDLQLWSLLDEVSNGHYQPTQEALAAAGHGSLSAVWPSFFGTLLTADQMTFLNNVVGVAHEPGDAYARVLQVSAEEAHTAAGGEWTPQMRHTSHEIAQRLASLGFLINHSTLDMTKVRPTYAGIVRATREAESEWIPLLRAWAEEGESANVDFKQQVDLDTASGKAKFIKHVLGIATTKLTAEHRAIVVGLDDKTREPVASLPAAVTQDRIDRLLHEYTEPTPEVRLIRVPWGGHEIGVLEIRREPARIPYRLRKTVGASTGRGAALIKTGQVFVRHGSSTEEPTPAELQALIEEGERAR